MDAITYYTYPIETDTSYTSGVRVDLYAGTTADRVAGTCAHPLGICLIDRHGKRAPAAAPRQYPYRVGDKLPGAINMAFFDGHADVMKLDDLWKVQWHRDWKTPAVHP
jgi:prepilin-type processing-associated H-X9-DG protein